MPINRDQHISKSANPNTQKKILSFQIFQTISWTLGSPRLGLSPILCPLYSLSKFSRFFFHKLMFLLITFLFISLQLVKFTFARKSISHLYSKKGVSSLVTEKITSLFIITLHCFTVRVPNQLAFRVRRAVTSPFPSVDQHYHLQ